VLTGDRRSRLAMRLLKPLLSDPLPGIAVGDAADVDADSD